jgi:hypothetical protein
MQGLHNKGGCERQHYDIRQVSTDVSEKYAVHIFRVEVTSALICYTITYRCKIGSVHGSRISLQQILMMGTKMVPETSVIFKEIKRLLASEDVCQLIGVTNER